MENFDIDECKVFNLLPKDSLVIFWRDRIQCAMQNLTGSELGNNYDSLSYMYLSNSIIINAFRSNWHFRSNRSVGTRIAIPVQNYFFSLALGIPAVSFSL